jgi:hypothetical protein
MSAGHVSALNVTQSSVKKRTRAYQNDRRLAWLLWGTVAASVSPLPAYLLGTGGNLVFLLGCLAFFVCFFAMGERYRIGRASFTLIPMLLVLPAAIYWQDPLLILFPIYLIVAILMVAAADAGVVRGFSSAASTSLLIIAIGAWVGVVYAFMGGASLYTIQNPDGRANELYLTTFSNWSIGNLIRPAGLFDEPGTLSFLICFVAALRSRLHQSPRMTWTLLVLGLVTTSLAHVVYMLLHAIQDWRFLWTKKKYLVAAGLLGAFAMANVDLPESAESAAFLSRFVVEDGKLGGDSRSELLSSAIEQIDLGVFLFGLDSDCVVRPSECATKGYGDFGETPAGMILLLGIFLSAPYFFVLGWSLYLAVRQANLVYIGLFLVLLQRPYVSTFGYSLLILLVVFGPRSYSVQRRLTLSRAHIPT